MSPRSTNILTHNRTDGVCRTTVLNLVQYRIFFCQNSRISVILLPDVGGILKFDWLALNDEQQPTWYDEQTCTARKGTVAFVLQQKNVIRSLRLVVARAKIEASERYEKARRANLTATVAATCDLAV